MGRLLILGGPSGSGKSTLQRMLCASAAWTPLVTITTRAPRSNEVAGRDYHFLSPEEFEAGAARGEITERTEYAGVAYGIYQRDIDAVRDGADARVVAVLDATGVAHMRRELPPHSVLAVFIEIGVEDMLARLSERPNATARVEQARTKELTPAYQAAFDVVLWNGHGVMVDDTYRRLLAVVAAEGGGSTISITPYLDDGGLLHPHVTRVFGDKVLPPAWRDALTRAAQTPGGLNYPFTLLAPSFQPQPLFRTLVDVDAVAACVYAATTAWRPRGERTPVALPPDASNPRWAPEFSWAPVHGRTLPLPAFLGATPSLCAAAPGRIVAAPLCVRTVDTPSGWLSAYAEPARVCASRVGCASLLDTWRARAGEIAAAAVAASKGGRLTTRGLREALQAAVAHTEVTAFPPIVAKAVMQLFHAKRVLDPCGGWGDRLLGALAAAGGDDRARLCAYVCTDPNPAVHAVYDAILTDLLPCVSGSGAPPDVAVHVCSPFEDVPLADEAPRTHAHAPTPLADAELRALNTKWFDLVFTSPPFFDLEVYDAADPAQSLARAAVAAALLPSSLSPEETRILEELAVADTPTRSAHLRAWVANFLVPMMTRAAARLRVGGHMVLSMNDFDGVSYVRAAGALAERAWGDTVVFRGVMGMDTSVAHAGDVKAPLFVWQRVAGPLVAT